MPTEGAPASIGACMQRLRRARGISLRQMGRILHVHHSTYASWEVNDDHIGARALLVIAHYLEVSLDELIPCRLRHPTDVQTYSINGAPATTRPPS